MAKPFENLKVLVVDDYESVRRMLCSLLEDLGLEVRQTSNGVEALSALREDPGDLVFTDLVMPEMDGFELCEEIRKSPALLHLPIIVCSTHYDSQYIVKALRMGADDYVPKPVEAELVRRVIARVLTPLRPATSPAVAGG